MSDIHKEHWSHLPSWVVWTVFYGRTWVSMQRWHLLLKWVTSVHRCDICTPIAKNSNGIGTSYSVAMNFCPPRIFSNGSANTCAMKSSLIGWFVKILSLLSVDLIQRIWIVHEYLYTHPIFQLAPRWRTWFISCNVAYPISSKPTTMDLPKRINCITTRRHRRCIQFEKWPRRRQFFGPEMIGWRILSMLHTSSIISKI